MKNKQVEHGRLIHNDVIIEWYELGYKIDINGNKKVDTLVIDCEGIPIFRRWLFDDYIAGNIVNILEKMEG